MTADEIAFAGGVAHIEMNTPYAWYYTNANGESIIENTVWWSLSPSAWSESVSRVWVAMDTGYPGVFTNGSYVGDVSGGARPAISLKTYTLWTSGNGAPETPYEISTTSVR